MNAVAEEEELPKVVEEKRRQDRHYLVGSIVFGGVVCACSYYIFSKLGLTPF